MQGRQEIEKVNFADGDWITAPEVAKLLRMTTAWVYTQTRAGLIPHVSLGRYVRYSRSGLDQWLGEIERGRTSSPEVGLRGVR